MEGLNQFPLLLGQGDDAVVPDQSAAVKTVVGQIAEGLGFIQCSAAEEVGVEARQTLDTAHIAAEEAAQKLGHQLGIAVGTAGSTQ